MAEKKSTVFSVRLPARVLQKLRWKAAELHTDPTELARQLIANGVKDAKQPIDPKNPAISVDPDTYQLWEKAAAATGAPLSEFVTAWVNLGARRAMGPESTR